MAKPKYTATLPDGQVVTRGTSRTYSHVVAVLRTVEHQHKSYDLRIDYLTRRNDGNDMQTVERLRAERAQVVERWDAVAWCGRPDLAAKQVEACERRGNVARAIVTKAVA